MYNKISYYTIKLFILQSSNIVLFAVSSNTPYTYTTSGWKQSPVNTSNRLMCCSAFYQIFNHNFLYNILQIAILFANFSVYQGHQAKTRQIGIWLK